MQIRKLLIANRGEIARRIMRSCRAMGIGTVAVFANADAAAPFVREADEAVALHGESAAETYLDAGKLIEAAHHTGAGAVHPGYGFLSESATFASAVLDAGLVWVGPRPNAIAAMGDKLEAKQRLTQAGVPMLSGLPVQGFSAAEIAARAEQIGYPVLVKAAGGGGGRGMRIVRQPSALAGAIASASREARRAFGNETVFLERYLEGARHIEVQIFGDKHGHLVYLFERECSIQRRHQKVIEEAPSPAVDADLRRRIGEAAVAAGRSIAYDNAGTVEFMLDARGQFYFLEVNTRLQVEHPVTEAITGLDLVREQLLVAQGAPLSFSQAELSINGHAIEARLYAEDPAKDFLPVSGRILTWEPDPLVPARFDSGVESGSDVSVYFDAMLAKVVAHAPTRGEAALRLALALERLRLHGLTTNRDFLVNTLRHDAFLAGETTTSFIEQRRPAPVRAIGEHEVAEAALAAALVAQLERRQAATLLRTLPSGWRNNSSQPQWTQFAHRDGDVRVQYERQRDGSFAYSAGERSGTVSIAGVKSPQIALTIDGLRRSFTVTRAAGSDELFVQTAAGEVRLRELPRFPPPAAGAVSGGYSSPMPGKVVQVSVVQGAAVKRGELLLTLEAMKMEHRIVAASDGVVSELRVELGQQVDGGQVLVVVETAG